MRINNLRILLVLCLVFLGGCAYVRAESKAKLSDAQDLGLSTEKIENSNPVIAGCLNILPGGGNVYLACTSDEKYNWPLFVINFASWPFSVLWGVPQAVLDAQTINKQATADYYMYDKKGKAEFEQAATSRK